MTTDIQTRQVNACPETISQGLDAVVRRSLSAIEGSPSQMVIYSDRAPTPDEREGLRKRAFDLDRAFAGVWPEEQVIAMVTAILLTKASRATDETEKRVILKAHVMALRGLPEWAIAEACRRFNDGRAGDLKWAPSPAELAEEARHVAQPFAKEHYDIKRILAAEVRTARTKEERERVSALFDSFLGHMHGSGRVRVSRRA